MTKLLHMLAPLALSAALAGCVVIPDTAPGAPPAPQGSAIALGRAVQVGAVVATPLEVVEDSRCPINARCVWPGRLVVKTRIDGAPGWRDTADLTLGEPFGTHDIVIALVSGEPGREAGEGRETPLDAYRFTYEPREASPR